MLELQKWNYETHKYEPYFVPDTWKVKTYSANMEEIVNCCQCGKEITFGESYTSHEVHTDVGFGYAVCEDCYYNSEVPRYENNRGNY